MIFRKRPSNQIEEAFPEWRDKFLSYKELKKRLKLVVTDKGGGRPNRRSRFDESTVASDDNRARGSMSREEIDFLSLLEDEMEKLNTFFVEKEEEYIIRLKELQDRLEKAKNNSEEMVKIRKEIMDFRGEMVLLENYSALNCTGLVKILKKYDRRTSALNRPPFIQRVLQQPFFTTELLYKLVKQCETMLDSLFPIINEKPGAEDAPDRQDGCDPTTSATTKDGDKNLMIRPYVLKRIRQIRGLKFHSQPYEVEGPTSLSNKQAIEERTPQICEEVESGRKTIPIKM